MGLQKSTIRYINSCYSHYYLSQYRPVSAGRDQLSHSLLLFKRCLQPDLSGWIDCSLEILAAGMPADGPGILPGILPDNHPSPFGAHASSPLCPIRPGASILRALHHQEITAAADGPTALDQLGRALAARFECRYSPSLLHKSRPTREIKGLTRQQREAELGDLYYIDPLYKDPALHYYNSVAASPLPSFLIIDDVLTTATTIKMIIGAIRQHVPRPDISIFTLAKADYAARLNSFTPLKGRHYQLQPGMDWLVSEETDP